MINNNQQSICRVAIAPVRAEPDDRSEMVTQLLLGEIVTVMNSQKQWLQVQCQADQCVGWLDSKQIIPLLSDKKKKRSHANSYALDPYVIANGSDHFLPVPMGATLPHFDGLRFWINDQAYMYQGQAIDAAQPVNQEWMIKMTRRYLHTPYLWGGRSSLGIDCSGLTQVIYKMAGILLPRNTAQQVTNGEVIHFLAESQPGDLAFFENDKGQISHVGILISPEEIVHAFGWVRSDRIDHYGIFNTEQNRYTHRLRVIKRLLPYR